MAKKSAKRKAKRQAISLYLGLNAVDPAHYEGWDGPLAACEFDARDMEALARSRGMSASVLLTRQATRARVLKAIRSAARRLKKGDFSPHLSRATAARSTT